jgi:predicted small integral membrane protein
MKSFFLPLTEPLGLIWLFMLIGVGFHLWRRQWRSTAWLGIPTALLSVLGTPPLVHALVANAELPYASDLRSQA